jgi:hypothetical protein
MRLIIPECVRSHACKSVCVWLGLYARTNANEFERKPMSAIERMAYGRLHSAKKKKKTFFFIFF